MISLQEFCVHLDGLLAAPEFKDMCPNGLQVEGSPQIEKAATAVSASLETIQAAVDAGVQALLVHHGMFWNRDSYVVTGVKREKLRLLMDNGISLLGYHLPLDAHQELGNNWKAAQDMGWRDLAAFGEFNGVKIGVMGQTGGVSAEDFVGGLEAYYEHQAHWARAEKPEIRSVALISGGAHWSITEAVKAGVDCFITGSFDEPIWHIAREENVHFVAMGHSASERIGPRALGEYVAKTWGIDCPFLDLPNPF